MIVVISDLHLQHTAQDLLSRSEGGKILATRVVRNVGAGALSLLFSEITRNAERTGAKEVNLVLAGDIFEMHRTPRWLLGGEALRPTLAPAASSTALEAKVLSILAAIEHDNAAFLETLARFIRTGEHVHRGHTRTLGAVAVRVHYIPGNHDRLLGVWPSTRRRVRELLGVVGPGGNAEAPFPHVLDWNRAAGYGVRIRHGHEYDPTNFSAPFDPAAPPSAETYERPALGDFVTVDLSTRLAVAFRAHYARELRLPGAPGEGYRRIYLALTEFDDVRPQSRLVQYLTDAVAANESRAFSILRPVLRDALETAMADSFFVSEAQRLGLGRYFRGPVAKLFDDALKTLSGETVGALVSVIDEFRRVRTGTGPALVARLEPGLATGEFETVIAGHTHEPDHVAMPGRVAVLGTAPSPSRSAGGGTEGDAAAVAYFLDSGTWRTRIDAGVGGAFGRLRGYTMVFCYHDTELNPGESRRFETWTGHLRGEEYGPRFSTDVTPAVRLPVQTVRFLECRVQHVDEGETPNGAELVLHFGVDGASLSAKFAGVKDGAVLELGEASTLSADPALDGEVWCYGIEEDTDSIVDRDDPMPWAVDFLPREAPGAPFVPGRREARAADNRGNAFTVVYEVG
jgi:UDP-2,3-diacylglucosamine pyrophosphatase LpxH